jgi:hypothetical protein
MDQKDADLVIAAMKNAAEFMDMSVFVGNTIRFPRFTRHVSTDELYIHHREFDAVACDDAYIRKLSLKDARDMLSTLIMALAGSYTMRINDDDSPNFVSHGNKCSIQLDPKIDVVRAIAVLNDLSNLMTSIVAARDHLTARIAESA